MLVLCFAHVAGANNRTVPTKTVPPGWIQDYDYKEDFVVYLGRKYQEAVDDKLIPYVYLFGDWCDGCWQLRKAVIDDAKFAQVFAGTRIVMLNYYPLKHVKNVPQFMRLGVPFIVPIEQDGTLSPHYLNGIPWAGKPTRATRQLLCNYFALRVLPGAEVDRGCSPDQGGGT